MYYIHIQNGQISGKGQARLLNAESVQVSQEVYNESEKYIAVPHEYEVEVQDYETIYEEQEMPIYDENGEIASYETITVEKQVEAGTHTETRVYYTIELNPDYEAEQAQKEKERIAMLSLTRGDVFRGLLQARGVTRLMLRGMIESNEQLTEIQKEMALIDFDEALNFYRGNALIDTVGLALGIEPAQLDCFFQTNDYTCLLPPVVEDEVIVEEDVIND